MRLPEIHSAEELENLVCEMGFLPFFKHDIEGFSIEECCPPELWFASDKDGPWEWKGPVARSRKCVYGKFFGGKAGFISLDWFPDFANHRRDGYDFDARCDDGLVFYKDEDIYNTIAENGIILSKKLKEICNYRKGENKGFDTVITRLQMQTYVCIEDFEYMKDKYGRTYGWGVARYSKPEELFGYETVTKAYKRQPQESKQRIFDYLSDLLPDATEKQIIKFIK